MRFECLMSRAELQVSNKGSGWRQRWGLRRSTHHYIEAKVKSYTKSKIKYEWHFSCKKTLQYVAEMSLWRLAYLFSLLSSHSAQTLCVFGISVRFQFSSCSILKCVVLVYCHPYFLCLSYFCLLPRVSAVPCFNHLCLVVISLCVFQPVFSLFSCQFVCCFSCMFLFSEFLVSSQFVTDLGFTLIVSGFVTWRLICLP